MLRKIRLEVLHWSLSRIKLQLEKGLKCNADKKSRRPTVSKCWFNSRRMKLVISVKWTRSTDKIALANKLKRNCREKPMNNSNTNQKCKKWRKKNSS